MIVLGIDPGLADTGFGLVEEKKSQFSALDFGTIKTKKTDSLEKRYRLLFENLISLIQTHRPEALAMETLFFSKNSKTAFMVGRSSGVVMLAAALEGIPVFEYTPPQVKVALTGSGNADKIQVQKMVKVLLPIKEAFQTDDVADALAIAICHLQNAKFKQKAGIIK